MPGKRPAYATRSGPLSHEERAELARLADRGLAPGQIAFRLGRHPSTVLLHFITLGHRPPTRGPAAPYVRRGRPVRQFQPEEDELMEDLARRSPRLSRRVIAEALSARFAIPRAGNSVRLRLLMLAARAEAALDGLAGSEA